MFLALRDLRRGWRRFGLVGLVVGLVAVLSTVLTGLADGLVRDGTSGLRALPITNIAFAPHSEAVFSRSTLDDRALRRWRAVPGAEATPIGVSFVTATAVDGRSIDLALFGVRQDSFLARESGGGARLDGLVLSSDLREEGARVGATYRVDGPTKVALRVEGFTFSGSYGHVPIAYLPLATWQRIAYGPGGGGRFSAIALRLPSGVDVTAVDRAADTETKTKEGAYDGSPGFTAETATMTLIRVFLLAISALVVGAFFTVLTVQRTPQIGLLKALGASSWYVLRDGVGGVSVIVVAATALGALGGTAIVAALDGGPVPVALLPVDILLSSVLLALAGIGASLACFRRIAKVEPAITLGVQG